jgi:hypothetical protein
MVTIPGDKFPDDWHYEKRLAIRYIKAEVPLTYRRGNAKVGPLIGGAAKPHNHFMAISS